MPKPIEKRLFKPVLTTQYPICPVPFRMDTYQGCKFNCNYCFARYFTTYARRTKEDGKVKFGSFTKLIGNDPVKFKAWLDRVMQNRVYNFKKGEEVALLERLPVKIGGVADPFPPIERKYRITYRILEAFHEYDYPVSIQTKNPSIISEYISNFDDPNWIVAVTIISLDEDFISTAEPGAPSALRRLKAVEKIAARGGKVICKIQPSIYPKIVADLPDLVAAFKDHGAYAFNTEGLKVRVVMNPEEANLFEKIGKYVTHDEFGGIGIRNYYKLMGHKKESDWLLKREHRKHYTDFALELADKHRIKYFTADNFMGKIGCSGECCGTEVLRDYKIWGLNHRTRYWGEQPHESKKMENVVINTFSYSTDKRRYKTLGEVMNKIFNPDQRNII